MVKMINGTFGNEMWVDESRVEEYRKRGHRVAAEVKKAAAKSKAPDTPKAPKKQVKKPVAKTRKR